MPWRDWFERAREYHLGGFRLRRWPIAESVDSPGRRKSLPRAWVWWLLLVFCGSETGFPGAVPHVLNYQGRLYTPQGTFTGTGWFKFALIRSETGQVLWRNAPDADADGEPDQPVPVWVERAVFSVGLGDPTLTNMAPLQAELFLAGPMVLRVWFSEVADRFEQLQPDTPVRTVAYALVAATVPDGSLTAAKFAPGTLATSNLVGTLLPHHLPALDASLLATGTVSPDRLPPALMDQLQHLQNEVVRLQAALQALETGGTPGLIQGSVAVSALARDLRMESLGLRLFDVTPLAAWVRGPLEGEPAARWGHTTLWTGEEVFVWGGEVAAQTYVNTGWLYAPRSDRWRPVNPAMAPTARTGHGAVWTGREVIVWGGFGQAGSDTGYRADGGRYHLQEQKWRPLSQSGSPQGRVEMVVEWTGRFMLVWGGRNASGVLQDGALYDPVEDRWLPLPTEGAPAARADARSAWTGTELLVWGGYDATGERGDGGRLTFDPNGLPIAWRALSTAGAPGARRGHVAVWSGTIWLIWGGLRLGQVLNDGARYDPQTDTWDTLPDHEAPAARHSAAAVWSGEEMLLWGGSGAGEISLASGAGFDPSSLTWRALSERGAPRPRSRAGMVWTGEELIVFGGRSNDGAGAGLERLNPRPILYWYRKP